MSTVLQAATVDNVRPTSLELDEEEMMNDMPASDTRSSLQEAGPSSKHNLEPLQPKHAPQEPSPLVLSSFSQVGLTISSGQSIFNRD